MKIVCALLAFVACSSLFGQQMPDDTERLAGLGRLWVTVNYFDPYVADRDIDWDQALIRALPSVRAAKTPDEYASALQTMLDTLHDPATYVSRHTSLAGSATLKYETKPGGTLVVSQISGESKRSDAEQLRRAVRNSRRIVFDLRTDGNSPAYLSDLLDRYDFGSELTPVPLDAPGERIWVHHGLTAPDGSNARMYYSAFQTKPGLHFKGNPSHNRRRVVFLTGKRSYVPAIACALAGAGEATILTDSPHYGVSDLETATIDMGAGIDAVVRLSEPIFSGGMGLPDARRVPQAHGLEQAIDAASLPPAAVHLTPLPMYPLAKPDRDYARPAYPAAEYRILAAYKVWGVFRYFFAYRDQMDEDWDDDFEEFLPKIAAAQNARDYNLAIAEFVARVHDSHAQLFSDTLLDYFGPAFVGLRLRLIEKRVVVSQVVDDAAKKAGVQPGDIVLKVDGERVSERANREAHYIPASTRQSLAYLVLQRVLNGPDGSAATLNIEGPDGQIKEVKLERRRTFAAALRHQRTGDIIKILPGNIGYADLDRLTIDQVDSMFDRLQSTKAIIFDMRGYPNGTAFRIASRLTSKQDVPVAIFTGPLVLAPDLPHGEALTQSASYSFVQKLPRTDKPRYTGKTVMLIDERTISRAEHAGLLFEAANRTTFIGTPTAGADGEISSFVVPGGITIRFSGLDVRHANGGQLQRLGLVPSIEVAPTIAGIRAGRDEVLEKAVDYLSEANRRVALIH